jgi:uncharacterized protein DUF1905/bacteriocin resistance YdeI/OmpD-like protein
MLHHVTPREPRAEVLNASEVRVLLTVEGDGMVRVRLAAWPVGINTCLRFFLPMRLNQMTKTVIRFKAKLLRPTDRQKDASWTFLILPKNASAKLPSRGLTTVEGTINGFPFQATLEPDGQKSHWLRVDPKLREAADAHAGDVVTLEIAPAVNEREPEVPPDLSKALAVCAPKAKQLWSDITPKARRDWIHWITSGKQAETRARRIKNACSMLAAGKRRPCCFDRSGFYSKSLSAPKAAT